jgi:hypothetical protein
MTARDPTTLKNYFNTGDQPNEGQFADLIDSFAGSIDVDGTLKAGAVDVTAVLANDVVTNDKLANMTRGTVKVGGVADAPSDLDAKGSGKILVGDGTDLKSVAVSGDATLASTGALTIADLAVSNAKLIQLDRWQLAPDPYCILDAGRHGGYGDGRIRWFVGVTTDLITGDANNPYSGLGGRTVRSPSTSMTGRRFYLDEMGLVPGDVVSFGTLVYLPATRTAVRLAALYYDSAGDPVSPAASNGTTTAGADATVLKTVLNATIPANTYSVVLQYNVLTGTGNVDTYAWYVQRGATLTTALTAPNSRQDGPTALRKLDILSQAPLSVGIDPYGIFALGPGETLGDGRTRWYAGVTNWSVVASDANNPYVAIGGRTARAASTTTGGRIYYMDECGLKPGDVISAAIYGYVPTTKTQIRLAFTFFNSIGGNLGVGGSTSSIYAGADVNMLVTVVNATIPPATSYFYVFFNLLTGTGNVDVYAWHVLKAGGVPVSMTTIPVIAQGQLAINQLQVAAGAYANLPARLTAIEAGVPSPYPATSLSYGVHLLHDWQAQLAKILSADTTSQAVVALLGDSWTNTDYRLAGRLRALAQADYGNAGVGWVSATDPTTVAVPTGVTKVQAGTWTNRDHTTTPRGRGIDLCEALSTDDSAPVGSVAITATFTDAAIHYLKQVDGATFRWQVDSDGWNAVDSAAGADAYTVIAITGKSNASHTLTIEVVDASSAGHTAGLVLFGVDCKITGNGVRVHKLGVSGATSNQWATPPDAVLWAAGLTALAPNLAIICLGTNDDSGDVAPATFRTRIEVLATAVRAALPSCDILYLSPAANGLETANGMAAYVTVLRASALANSYAMFDAYLLLPDYTTANARGLYDNTSHINALGGRVIIGRMYRDMLKLD